MTNLGDNTKPTDVLNRRLEAATGELLRLRDQLKAQDGVIASLTRQLEEANVAVQGEKLLNEVARVTLRAINGRLGVDENASGWDAIAALQAENNALRAAVRYQDDLLTEKESTDEPV